MSAGEKQRKSYLSHFRNNHFTVFFPQTFIVKSAMCGNVGLLTIDFNQDGGGLLARWVLCLYNVFSRVITIDLLHH